MIEYNKEIANQLCDMIQTDSYTVAELCKIVGITEDTFNDWLNGDNDFSESIKKAEREYTKSMLVECERSLSKLIKGYTVNEEQITILDLRGSDVEIIDKPKVIRKEVLSKHFQPNMSAIAYYQTNKASGVWKNKKAIELDSQKNNLSKK